MSWNMGNVRSLFSATAILVWAAFPAEGAEPGLQFKADSGGLYSSG